jgi:hypothetical protein
LGAYRHDFRLFCAEYGCPNYLSRAATNRVFHLLRMFLRRDSNGYFSAPSRLPDYYCTDLHGVPNMLPGGQLVPVVRNPEERSLFDVLFVYAEHVRHFVTLNLPPHLHQVPIAGHGPALQQQADDGAVAPIGAYAANALATSTAEVIDASSWLRPLRLRDVEEKRQATEDEAKRQVVEELDVDDSEDDVLGPPAYAHAQSEEQQAQVAQEVRAELDFRSDRMDIDYEMDARLVQDESKDDGMSGSYLSYSNVLQVQAERDYLHSDMARQQLQTLPLARRLAILRQAEDELYGRLRPSLPVGPADDGDIPLLLRPSPMPPQAPVRSSYVPPSLEQLELNYAWARHDSTLESLDSLNAALFEAQQRHNLAYVAQVLAHSRLAVMLGQGPDILGLPSMVFQLGEARRALDSCERMVATTNAVVELKMMALGTAQEDWQDSADALDRAMHALTSSFSLLSSSSSSSSWLWRVLTGTVCQ